ncbi:hypothetical protein L7F22_009148 [Adiantum nelumboides]|nr:hypothetical protein [Adiantum nelumboides]
MASFIHSFPFDKCRSSSSELLETVRGRTLSVPSLGAVVSSHAPTFSTSYVTGTETSLSSPQVQLAEEPCSFDNTAKDWRSKGSSQLTRWARTRKLRSGRPSGPPLEAGARPATLDLPAQEIFPIKRQSAATGDEDIAPAFLGRENAVYMVSDGTGWTAEHSVHAALGQFEHCLVDHGCPVSTHLFSEINGHDVTVLLDIGSSHNFVDAKLVQKLNLQKQASDHEYCVKMAQGEDTDVWNQMVQHLELELADYKENLDFHIMRLDRADVILGIPWFYDKQDSLYIDYVHQHDMPHVSVSLCNQISVNNGFAIPVVTALEMFRDTKSSDVDFYQCIPSTWFDLLVLGTSVTVNFINDVERLMEIIRDAGKEQAVFVYTIADPALAEAAKKACELHGIPHLDIFGPITELLSTYLGVTPLGLPRGAPGRKSTLSKQYFKRIEAVEFTIKQDDGALPKNLHKADLVLIGVSRTSKTPLSTYIAQKGYKVANVPLVLGIDPPSELFQIDQSKIYALTINPNYLHSIRTARSKTLGVSTSTSYSEMEHIRRELEYSRKLFLENPKWPVIEVTGKAIEETAAVILRIYHDRERKFVMPRISWRY